MQKYEHSYMFETRHRNGMVKLWNGYHEREGGLSSMNDARGLGRRNNCATAFETAQGDYSEDNIVRALKRIPAVSSQSNRETWAARELLMSYGKAFWMKQQEPTA